MTDRRAALVERLVGALGTGGAVEWSRDGGLAVARLVVGGDLVAAVGVPLDLPAEEAARRVLDGFQDAVLAGGNGAPTPSCPVAGHAHPAVVRAVDGGVAWRCPADD